MSILGNSERHAVPYDPREFADHHDQYGGYTHKMSENTANRAGDVVSIIGAVGIALATALVLPQVSFNTAANHNKDTADQPSSGFSLISEAHAQPAVSPAVALAKVAVSESVHKWRPIEEPGTYVEPEVPAVPFVEITTGSAEEEIAKELEVEVASETVSSNSMFRPLSLAP
ncbi:MAG: hypothetical protein H6868_02655 [Rhodospirillales bacterium]|nr:hypothetical protein [Rhodospirillales bacterium]